MRHILLSLTLCILAVLPASAQSLWNRTYGKAAVTEYGRKLIWLSDGTLLLSGTSGFSASSLYLARTNEQGDTLWTRRQRIRSFASVEATQVLMEDNAGHVLVGGRSVIGTRSTGFAALFNLSTGDTVWTRTLGPDLTLSDGVFGADQNFTLAASQLNQAYLIRLSASGQLLQQVPVDYNATDDGWISRLVRGNGGYWLALNSYNGQNAKFVFVDDSGVRGAEVTSMTAAINNFIAVESGHFLVTSSSGISKYSPTFSLLWSQPRPIVTGFSLSLEHVQRNTNGEYVVVGTFSPSHTSYYYLARYDAQGNYLGSSFAYTALAGNGNVTSLAISPVTGNYYLGYGVGDMQLLALRGAAVTATTPAATWAGQLYPNPVGATETLQLSPAAPLAGTLQLTDLRGRLVRQWPAQPAATRYELPLQGLAAGLYQLRLTDQQGHPATLKVAKE
jgi:hypothetical protein